MRVAVFGATGATGQHLVSQLKMSGHSVSALVRRGDAAGLDGVQLIQGNVLTLSAVLETLKVADTAVSCLGPTLWTSLVKNNRVGRDGTACLLEAMRQIGMKRLVVTSAFGAADSRSQTSLLFRMAMSTLLRGIYADKNEMERLVTQSEMEWTVVRPTNLSNTSPAGQIVVNPMGKLGLASHINRADVARFLMEVVTGELFVRKAVTISAA